MRKILSLLMALTVVSSLSLTGTLAPHPASAQDVGDTVTLNDIDGNEIGLATIEEIVDPFEDFDTEPARGLRFVSIELTIENTSEDPISVSPGNIGVVDDSGLIYSDVDVTRTDRVDSLEATDLEPGDEISGALEIGLPEESEITQIFWLIGTGQIPTLYRDVEPVGEGDEAVLFNADYEEEAVLVTEDVVDEFDDLDDDVELNAGFKGVGVTVTIENTGAEDLVVDPNRIFLATTDGVFWSLDPSIIRSQDSIADVPDLTDDPIAPGDSVTGFLMYGARDNAEIDYVFYFPADGTRFVRIYDADTGGTTRDDDEPTPNGDEDERDDDGGLGPIGRKTPTPEDDNGNNGDNGDNGDVAECEGAAEWADATIENLDGWVDALSRIDINNLDPDELQLVIDDLNEVTETQQDLDVPPAAEELNDLLITAFEDTAEAVDMLREGAETGDDQLIGEGAAMIAEIGTSFQEGEVADVLADTEKVCPEISDL